MSKSIPEIDWKIADQLIEMALNEDLDEAGDITTASVVPLDLTVVGRFICKEPEMVIAGLGIAERVIRKLDPNAEFTVFKKDGTACFKGDVIAEVKGKARALLTGERTALNFIQRLSGVATASSRYAKALEGTETVVLDTRKTTPGYRNLEKYAVAIGGGTNHRIGLFDMAMIKDNHRTLASMAGPGGITRSVSKIRSKYPNVEIEVEADTLTEVREAADAGAEYILLDNMSDEDLEKAVKIVAKRAKTEASGGITYERLPRIAKVGVDYVSVGALTHSVRAMDISFDIITDDLKEEEDK